MESRELCVITGASRGYGAALARQFTEWKVAHKRNFDLVLMSRSEKQLEELKNILTEIVQKHKLDAAITTVTVDFLKLDTLPEQLHSILSKFPAERYSNAFLFHNAGQLGVLKPVREQTDFKDLQRTIDMHLTSPYILSSIFLAHFVPKSKVYVINISSKAAILATPTWGTYCVPKAARNMLHAIIAAEEDEAQVKSLNWGPGIMNTSMQDELQAKGSESGTKDFLKNVIQSGKDIPTDVSAKKLMEILQKDEFKSGSHLDVYEFCPEYAPTR